MVVISLGIVCYINHVCGGANTMRDAIVVVNRGVVLVDDEVIVWVVVLGDKCGAIIVASQLNLSGVDLIKGNYMGNSVYLNDCLLA